MKENRPITFPSREEEFCIRILNRISFDDLKSNASRFNKLDNNQLIYIATDSKILFEEAVKILCLNDSISYKRDLSEGLPKSFPNDVGSIQLINLQVRKMDDLHKLKFRITKRLQSKKQVLFILQGSEKDYYIFKNEDSQLFDLPTLEKYSHNKTELFFNLLVKNGLPSEIEHKDIIIRKNLYKNLLMDFNSVDDLDHFIINKRPPPDLDPVNWFFSLEATNILIEENAIEQEPKYKFTHIIEDDIDEWEITIQDEGTKKYSYKNNKGIKYILYLWKYTDENNRIDIKDLSKAVNSWHSKKSSGANAIPALVKSIKADFAELNPEKRKPSKSKKPKEHPNLTELTASIILGSQCYFDNPKKIPIEINDPQFPSKLNSNR